jgi:hypothetical protein
MINSKRKSHAASKAESFHGDLRLLSKSPLAVRKTCTRESEWECEDEARRERPPK